MLTKTFFVILHILCEKDKQAERKKEKPIHPMENDECLPDKVRGNHYESWTELAKDLGYGE